jgi:hypothetical protein
LALVGPLFIRSKETTGVTRYFLLSPLQVAVVALVRLLALEKTAGLEAAVVLPAYLFLGKDMQVDSKAAERRGVLVAEGVEQGRWATLQTTKHLIFSPAGTAAALGFVAR